MPDLTQHGHQGHFMPNSRKPHKSSWQLHEAKAELASLIEKAQTHVQTIKRYGEPVAVVISVSEYKRLTRPKESLLDFFKRAPCQDVDLDITRSKDPVRDTLC